jgi:hypothetical protein
MANVVVTDDAYADLYTTLQSLSRRALPVHVVDSGTLVEGWAAVLAVGAGSSGTSPVISAGDHLAYESATGVATSGDLRVGELWSLVGWDSVGFANVPLLSWDGTLRSLRVGDYGCSLTARGAIYVYLQVGGASRARVSSTEIESYVSTIRWGSSVVAPVLTQDGTAGETLTIVPAPGTTDGADLLLRSSSGSATCGDVVLRPAASSGGGTQGRVLVTDEDGNPIITAGDIGLGFWTGTPAVAPAVAGARDDPEEALKNLLSVLSSMGLITDNTTAS